MEQTQFQRDVNKVAERFTELAEGERTLKEVMGTIEVDFTNTEHLTKYIELNLKHIESEYYEYQKKVDEVQKSNKYSGKYKRELVEKLRESFLKYKDDEFTKAREKVAKVKGILQGEDDFKNKQQDPLLIEINKMNLLNMINLGLKFEDDTFIKSKLDEIIQHNDLKMILENKIKKSPKNYLVADIEKAYLKKNEKYLVLDDLDNKIQMIRNQRNMLSTSLDIKNAKWINIK